MKMETSLFYLLFLGFFIVMSTYDKKEIRAQLKSTLRQLVCLEIIICLVQYERNSFHFW